MFTRLISVLSEIVSVRNSERSGSFNEKNRPAEGLVTVIHALIKGSYYHVSKSQSQPRNALQTSSVTMAGHIRGYTCCQSYHTLG